MMKPHAAAIAVTALVLAACTGTVRMEAVADNTLPQGGIDGVIVYPPAIFKELSATTAYVVKGEIKGTSEDGTCTPIISEKLVVMADLAHPRRIFYDPGILENHAFSVKIDDGLLTAVNTESSPERGATIGTLAAAAAALAGQGIFGLGVLEDDAGAPGPSNACNTGSTIVGLERYSPK